MDPTQSSPQDENTLIPQEKPPVAQKTQPTGKKKVKKDKDEEINNLKKEFSEAQKVKDEEIAKLKQSLEQAQKNIEDLTNLAKHALADLQNNKRRVEEEKSSFIILANASLISEILPILDNFNRAFKIIPEELKKNDWILGIMAIEKQLQTMLEKEGLKEIKTIGEKFNPHLHEPLMQGPGAKDTILEEFEKGYLLKEKVLKPAKVKIGDGTTTSK